MSLRTLECELCPKRCRIAPGQSGDCRIRINLDGRLLATTYGLPSAVHVDPIEKKPLFHFLPSTPIFSVATVGCNLHCKNCQNWEISQRNPEDAEAFALDPERVVALARRRGCRSIAYTYTEPIVFYEYARDTGRAAHEAGLRNVLVTAGYANPDPWAELCRVTDAANVDLKALDDEFYRTVCNGTLSPVLEALVLARKLGVWLEITNLVIPGLNDDLRLIARMCRWIVGNLGADTPLHFSRFSPRHLMRNLPSTPSRTLRDARDAALAEGLRYVYVGNVPGGPGESTICPGCGATLIQRVGYRTRVTGLERGRCTRCQQEIAGVWT